MSVIETAFALLGVVAAFFGVIAFARDVRYDPNTQKFLKQDLWRVVRHSLLCALSAGLVGGMALGAVGVFWRVLAFIYDFFNPPDFLCAAQLSDIAACFKSAAFEPLANTIALIAGGLGACLGGLIYLTAAWGEWRDKRKPAKSP